jgi:hypothetical protein
MKNDRPDTGHMNFTIRIALLPMGMVLMISQKYIRTAPCTYAEISDRVQRIDAGASCNSEAFFI